MAKETNILDFIAVVVRWRRMILTSVLLVTLAAVGISLILPNAYTARAVVYPPEDSQDLFGLSNLVGNLPMGMMGMGDTPLSATDFVPVIESERVRQAVIDRFSLGDRYEHETREELMMMVEERLEVELSREQFLTVSYEDETPQLAADITNTFVEELDRALQERSAEQASSLRLYLENRLTKTEQDMLAAEAVYNAFQMEHMAIDLETQAKAQIEGANEMFTSLAELIVEGEITSAMMGKDNPRVKEIGMQIAGARKALNRMLMTGALPESESENAGQMPDIFIPFDDVPKLGGQSVELLRDVRIQNAIYQFVRQEYEKALFEEEKNTTRVVVLDRAMAPDTRSSPRRSVMVILAFSLSLVVSVLIAFLLEGYRRMDDDDRAKVDGILTDLRSRT